MSNKNPASRMVSIPSQFMPLVEKEREEMDCFTTCECMGRILSQYFRNKNISPQKTDKPTKNVIKGVKPDDK